MICRLIQVGRRKLDSIPVLKAHRGPKSTPELGMMLWQKIDVSHTVKEKDYAVVYGKRHDLATGSVVLNWI